MRRVLEPELMEDDAQARAYAQADFEAPHRLIAAALLERAGRLPSSGIALDLGCGPADITLRVARGLPGWRVDGVDGSPAMLRYGQEALAASGLGERVRLLLGRLPDEQLPEPAYDLVFSNSLLHHLPEPALLWGAVRRHARPGAPVVILDLMRPDSPEAAAAMVERYSGGEPEILKRDFYYSLCAALSVEEVRASLAAAGLALEVEALSDRHLVAWGAA